MENIESAPIESSYEANQDIQIVAFKLGKEEYAVDILHVQEINRLLNIPRVPRTERYIEGVVNLRGNIVPIINLHTKYSIQSAGDEEDKRIIVFQIDDLKVGIIVDEVSEVINIKAKDIEETGRVYESASSEHIKGVVKVDDRLMILLDLNKIFD